ncbi:MAG TPA: hypothetical protein VIL31_18050 [Cyclobacteriaceae bacterium]
MKNSGLKWLLGAVLMASSALVAFGQQYEAEVPGDNFSLEGALELFRKSSTPEEFERLLNTPDSKVNNLDLNGDGYIDYIRVLSRQDKNVHIFVLQAVISETEEQDIAVISLEKLANGKAILQITGDEDIYGVTTIIEPTREVRTYAGTYATPVVVNVWSWPIVQYVYGPHYTVWVSHWGWHRRPHWWRPWRPIYYYDYYSYWIPYYRYYSVCPTPRIVYAHTIYHPHRRTSVIVHRRYNTQIVHYRSKYPGGYADYRNGRTRNDNRYSNPSGNVDNGRRRTDLQSTPSREVRTSVTPARQVPQRSLSEQRNVPDRVRTGRVVTPDDGNVPTPQSQSPTLNREQTERFRQSAPVTTRPSTTPSTPTRTAPVRSNSGSSGADNSRRESYTPPARQQSTPNIQRDNLPSMKSNVGGGQRTVSPPPARDNSSSYQQRSGGSSSPASQRSSGTTQRSNGDSNNGRGLPGGRGRR